MTLRSRLLEGRVLPALPLAIDANRKWSPRHQRALLRYYHAAGAGGIAAAVHSTQFEIREPAHALLEPVLALTAEEIGRWGADFLRIAGVCGKTPQAIAEATLAHSLGFDAVLLSLAAWKTEPEADLVAHCSRVAEVMPVIGFYLQPGVGGRPLSHRFWRDFSEIENVVAIKIAPFNRFQTIDVVRALAESGRDDVALYTGNDDSIVIDLLTPFRFVVDGREVERRIVGGLLGHWGVWTKAACDLFRRAREARTRPQLDASWLAEAVAVTDMNAAVFDPQNGFAGCIPGILEVLRRQGLVPTNLCLNPHEQLSPGQAAELDRVTAAYPRLVDDDFVREHLDAWLS